MPNKFTSKNRRHFLPGFADVAFLFLGMVLVTQYGWYNLLGDGDTQYHIRAGQVMLENRQVLHHDPFSYGMEGRVWVAHEWLSEVLMGAIASAFGLDGVCLLYMIVLGLAFFLLVRYAQRRFGLLAAVVMFFLFVFSSVHWLARPHIWTYLGIVLFVGWLDRLSRDEPVPVWAFPATTLVWANLHGGFVIGLFLIGISLGSAFIDRFRQFGSTSSRIKNLTVVFLLSCAASLVNPYGLEIWLNPIRFLGDSAATAQVQEFLSPNFRENPVLLFDLMAVIALYLLSSLRVSSVEFMRFMGFGVLGLQAVRHMPVFFIANVSGIGRRVQQITRESWFPVRIRQKLEQYEEIDSTAVAGFWPAIFVITLVAMTASGVYHFTLPEKSYPKGGLEFLRHEQLRGNGFNDDEFGDYMIRELWPQYSVFVDGRSDFYSGKRTDDYHAVIFLKPSWEEALDQNKIEWVFTRTDQRLSVVLKTHPGWHRIYEDKIASIFVRKTPYFQELIEKYPLIKPDVDKK